MAFNYTLSFVGELFDEFSRGLFENMGKYLEKRNIRLVDCPDCLDLNDLEIFSSEACFQRSLQTVISLNFTCNYFGFASVVPFSISPTPSRSSTTDIINIDASVVICLFLGGTLSAAIVAFLSKSKSNLKVILRAWLENNWINFSHFFFESSDRLPSSWRARMVLTTWLLTTLLISVEVSSYLKSSFTVTTYHLIDRYQDALKYHDVTFEKIRYSPSERISCSTEEYIKYNAACRSLNSYGKIQEIFLAPENTLGNPWEIKVLMVTPTDLKRFARRPEFQKIRESGLLFYTGQISVDVYIFFMVKNWVRRNPFLSEELAKSIQILIENNPWAYTELEGGYKLESILWKKPTEEGTELYLEDCLVVFDFLLIGIAISCIIFLIEVGSYFILR